MVLAVAFMVLFSPHYPWYFAWLIPFVCIYPLRGRDLSDLRGELSAHLAIGRRACATGSSSTAALRLVLLGELAVRRFNKKEEEHGDAVACLSAAVDPRRYFESVGDRARAVARSQAGLPLSGDHQPLQPALHHLPAHLCGARAAGRHELGAVHLDRRSGARRCSAPCCTASASPCWSRTCPRWCAISRTAAPTCCSTPTARCSTSATAVR